ncbi:MAG TPA: arginine--tRNA ligase [Nitrospira sp.]|nr:arginine--tRNA ligase [Nitrospira sp.]MCW5795006.1 arginine--tRNA ligase [Nitrospira sp.]HMU30528.1 arginine--tRNA ligase [Nitrospira sp.]HMV55747.1 arginine--tRNA ligase [Nitrospira sp.]HMW84905.1 arginine--tRNA ligase [Nitrospira sp.]
MAQGVVQDRVADALAGALRSAQQRGILKIEQMPTINLEAPKRPEWGDVSCTVAMSLSASERRPPFEIAQIIADHIQDRDALFSRVDIARPGFLNLTLQPDLWMEVLRHIETQRAEYGHSRLGQGRRVLVEYVSANPTGPLHVGHGRGAAVGQALVRLLRATGHEVVSEYYINDAGRQMKLLGVSVLARYLESCGQAVPFPEDGYQGEYIRAVAARVKAEQGVTLLSLSSSEAEQRSKDFAYRELLALIRQDLETFGITFESWFSEASLLSSGAVEQVLSELRSRDLLFDQDGAQWFRSSAYGDEKDRVVRKQEGDYTYLASDIAYHRDKLRRGFDLLVDVWGADHHGYIPRMQAVVQAYGYPKERLRVVLVQMVNLLRGGRKVEMSKRAGEFITLREVMDEVGADAAKFFFLMRDSSTHLDFDLELAKQQSQENPVYYVQYAHARISSLLRVAASRGIECPLPSQADLKLLNDPDELAIIRKLSVFPVVLEASAVELEPHRMAYYLRELAGLVHPFYNKHRILPPMTDLDATPAAPTEPSASTSRVPEAVSPGLTGARLALMWSVQQVVRNGLTVLGVSSPEQM